MRTKVAVLCSLTLMVMISTTCGLESPTIPTGADVTFLSPRDGETLRIGDTTTISWACACSDRYEFAVRVFTSTGAMDISPRLREHSFRWIVGNSVDTLVLLPGEYRIELDAFMSDGESLNPHNEVSGPVITLVD